MNCGRRAGGRGQTTIVAAIATVKNLPRPRGGGAKACRRSANIQLSLGSPVLFPCGPICSLLASDRANESSPGVPSHSHPDGVPVSGLARNTVISFVAIVSMLLVGLPATAESATAATAASQALDDPGTASISGSITWTSTALGQAPTKSASPKQPTVSLRVVLSPPHTHSFPAGMAGLVMPPRQISL